VCGVCMRKRVQRISAPSCAGLFFLLHLSTLEKVTSHSSRHVPRQRQPLEGFSLVPVLTKASTGRPTQGEKFQTKKTDPHGLRKSNLLCCASARYGSENVVLSIQSSSSRSFRSMMCVSSFRVSAQAPRDYQQIPAGSQTAGAMTGGGRAPAPRNLSPGACTSPPAA